MVSRNESPMDFKYFSWPFLAWDPIPEKPLSALSSEDLPIELSPIIALMPGDNGMVRSSSPNVISIPPIIFVDPLKKLGTVFMREMSVTAIARPLKVGRHLRYV